MNGAELRDLLEKHWAENRGRTQAALLDDFGISRDIAWLGAVRVADRQERYREMGDDPEDDPGGLWMDGFIAGLAVRSAET